MGYHHGRTMNICSVLFMIFFAAGGGHGQYYGGGGIGSSNRDIILTPHQLKSYPGKIVYYRPREVPLPATGNPSAAIGGSNVVPWEEVLKETVFLALNDNKTSTQQSAGTTVAPLSVKRQQKAIYSAPYVGNVDLSIPRFGDIVELARGRLEQDGEESYHFVQEDGGKGEQTPTVGRNVSAYWKVERIRHRDDQRGHRFEMKFSVAPTARDLSGEQPTFNRSFVIRDDEYPKYFGPVSPNVIPMVRKNDQFYDRTFFDLQQQQQQQQQPQQSLYSSFPPTRYYRPAQQTMTFGEYLMQSLLSSDSPKMHHHNHYHGNKLQFASSNRIKFPDSFTTSSYTVPKFYHHIHVQRPSIAPLAPTHLYPKETHLTAPSNLQPDYTKLVDLRGAADHPEARPNNENNVIAKPSNLSPVQAQPQSLQQHLQQPPQQQLLPQQQQQQPFRQSPQVQQPLPHHAHNHQQVPSSQQSQLPMTHIQQGPIPQPHLPPPHVVQSIPIYNPQSQVVLNHIPIASNHMFQMSQPPIAIPVHVQLIPSHGQLYAQQQDAIPIPVRIMQPISNAVHFYSPVNPFLAQQQTHLHHPLVTVTPKTTHYHGNQTNPHHHHHAFNTIPTTLKFTSSNAIHPQRYSSSSTLISGTTISPTVPNHRYTPNVQISGPSVSPTTAHHRFSTAAASAHSSTSSSSPTSATSQRHTGSAQSSGPTASPTAANHRYAPLPTVQASPAGLREKFTAPAFSPAASESKQSTNRLPPVTAKDTVGSPSNAVSPKFESFGVENAVTPTTESPRSPSTGTVSFSSNYFTNFIDEKGTPSESSRYYSSKPHGSTRLQSVNGRPTVTTPISITTHGTVAPHGKSYVHTLGPTIGTKYPPAFKSMPSVTILPPQIETPISSTLKTYQYLNHHDNYEFIPSRVVELAHVKKVTGGGHKHPKQNKRKHQSTGHHHVVTVTSNKPLKFHPGDGPEFATHRPESQLSVQLPPPEKEFTMTYYGTPKHNQRVQKPKNYVTPVHHATTSAPFTVSLTTPASTGVSTTPTTPANVSSTANTTTTTTSAPSRSATTERNSFYQSSHYYKNKHEKSDDIITTVRPRMLLKTIYKPYHGSPVPALAITTSTEKPLQKWVPKRPRTKTTSGEQPTSTVTASSSSPTLAVNLEQAVAASSDHASNAVTHKPQVTSVRPTLEQQVTRVRASRGRSRYTHRRAPAAGNPIPLLAPQPPPMTGQAQRTSRMRTIGTTTMKPMPTVTSAVFDSNRLERQSFDEPQDQQNEKSKRDTTAEDQENEVFAGEQLSVNQMENTVDALAVTAPEKEYVMVKANIQPIATNQSNVIFFEASDASSVGSDRPRALSSTSMLDDLTMSIINHAKALVNHQPTDKPGAGDDDDDDAGTTVNPTGGKTIESNEINHRAEPEEEQVPVTTVAASTTVGSTVGAPLTDSTVDSDGRAAITTTVAVDSETTAVAEPESE